MLEEAKKYIEQGWSIIPVKGKIPQVKWEEYRQRYPTQEELEKWFGTAQNSLGIVTGKLSNISVIDVDGPTSISVISPVVVKSPRGHHYYFQYHKGLSNYVRIKENMDIRTEGGFCVAPPTVGYQWANGFTVKDLPPFPIHLFETELKPELAQTKWPTNKIAEAIANLKQGNRNDTFTYLAGSLHDGRKSASDIFTLLRPHAHICGFSDTELSQIVASVLRYHRDTPVQVYYPSDNIDNLKQYMDGQSNNTTLDTGIFKLDAALKGLRKGEIYTIGARTKLGKTTLALNITYNLLTRNKRVLLFTTEMSRYSILDRLTARNSEERYTTIQTWGKALAIVDKSSPTMVDVQTISKEVKPDILIFDHIQHTGGFAQTDRENVSRFVRGLKDVGTSCECAVILCSQIRRLWRDRQGVESAPTLSDLKESGTIEEESAVVILLSNLESSYNSEKVNILVDVAANRYGETTKFGMEFNKKLGTFKEIE